MGVNWAGQKLSEAYNVPRRSLLNPYSYFKKGV